MLAQADVGAPKLHVLHRALSLRRQRPEDFGPQGEYRPLATAGQHHGRIVAFARGTGVVTVVPRLVLGLDAGWGDTTVSLPRGRWVPVLAEGEPVSGTVPVAQLLSSFPVALLRCP